MLGHAIAKSLGFYAATPLLVARPGASGHRPGGVATSWCSRDGFSRRTRRPAALPLFVSEVLIVAGGFQAGHDWVAAIAAVLLALGFLGLAPPR